MTLDTFSWLAVVVLSIGYWFQIWKIHVHKEVRDLSLTYHIMLACGFSILGVTAFFERSVIFLVKQIATTIPVIVIIAQILYHKRDRWHDASLPLCASCQNELQKYYLFCPRCGVENPNKNKQNLL